MRIYAAYFTAFLAAELPAYFPKKSCYKPVSLDTVPTANFIYKSTALSTLCLLTHENCQLQTCDSCFTVTRVPISAKSFYKIVIKKHFVNLLVNNKLILK